MTEVRLTFTKYLMVDAQGKTILQCVEQYFGKRNIPFINITAVVTDGAPAIVNRFKGFASLLKKKVPGVLTVHCLMYRQHLVATKFSDRLHDALKVRIRAINKIKPQPLDFGLFV